MKIPITGLNTPVHFTARLRVFRRRAAYPQPTPGHAVRSVRIRARPGKKTGAISGLIVGFALRWANAIPTLRRCPLNFVLVVSGAAALCTPADAGPFIGVWASAFSRSG